MFPGMEILVIENGCVDVASGVAKADYIARHVLEVQRAVADGVPVSAYVCWSITSNREWGLPLGADSDFGLYHIDLDGDPALRRVPTAAAATYREIIARRSAAGVAPPTELRD
jgi:beta-glucosidase/6-phospho-beta-glucosidase/beta-galactosidase